MKMPCIYRVMERETNRSYLGKATLVRQISSMNQDVPLGQLDRAVVGVTDTDDSCPPSWARD